MMLLARKSVFIVEDNIIDRISYHYILMNQGVHIEFERSGRRALARLENLIMVDLIILDLYLGRETGFNVFVKIRDLPRYTHIPIIAVTSAHPSDAIFRCRELGFNGYISKPINESLFPQQISQVLLGENLWISASIP